MYRNTFFLSARGTTWYPLAIFGLAATIRLGYLFFNPLIERDGILYLRMAEYWHRHTDLEGMNFFLGGDFSWIPYFPVFLMKSLMPIGLSAESSARLLVLLCGSLLPLIGIAIVREMSAQNRSGIILSDWTGILLAVHPFLVRYSTQPTRETLYLFWCFLTLYFLCRGFHRRAKAAGNWGIAGIFCAAAWLTRYEGIEILPLVLLFLLLAGFASKYPPRLAAFHGSIFAGVTVFCFLLGGFAFRQFDHLWRHCLIYLQPFTLDFAH